MKQHTKKQHRRGVSLAEYGILAALIAVAGITTIKTLGTNTTSMYCQITSSLSSSTSEGSTYCGPKGTPSPLYATGYKGNISTAGGASCNNICSSPNITSVDSETIEKLNAIDPITGFYGLINKQTGQTPSNANQAYALTNINGTGIGGITDSDGNTYQYEAKGASGNTYGFFTSDYSMGYRNMETGETYYLNTNTGNIIDEGITTGNIDYKNLFSN